MLIALGLCQINQELPVLAVGVCKMSFTDLIEKLVDSWVKIDKICYRDLRLSQPWLRAVRELKL